MFKALLARSMESPHHCACGTPVLCVHMGPDLRYVFFNFESFSRHKL